MFPAVENSSLDFPRYIDVVCPKTIQQRTNSFLNCSCIFLLPEFKKMYVHKITMFKICELCYLQINIPSSLSYNVTSCDH